MIIAIEVFINGQYQLTKNFDITNTLKDVRKELKIEGAKDYTFLLNNNVIEFEEEDKYAIKDIHINKKIYMKKTNPFLSKFKGKSDNKNSAIGNKNKNIKKSMDSNQKENKIDGKKELKNNKTNELKKEKEDKKDEKSEKDTKKEETNKLKEEKDENKKEKSIDKIEEKIIETPKFKNQINDNKIEKKQNNKENIEKIEESNEKKQNIHKEEKEEDIPNAKKIVTIPKEEENKINTPQEEKEAKKEGENDRKKDEINNIRENNNVINQREINTLINEREIINMPNEIEINNNMNEQIEINNINNITNEREANNNTNNQREVNNINNINNNREINNAINTDNRIETNSINNINNNQRDRNDINIGRDRGNINNRRETNYIINQGDISTISSDLDRKETDEDSFDITENYYDIENIKYDIIENSFENNSGIEKLTIEDGKKVKIKKELLKTVNSFIACLGPPGSGKSTFCSNYYKKLYKVKYDYFESSDANQSFTKGIWMVSDAERRKIPIMIKKDLLDVEGFQADAEKCWKYVMIIAFLATELLILNRDARYDNVKKVLKIIQKSLSIMRKKNMPRILKTIYIHTAYKKPKQTCEELLNEFNCDKTVFDNIKFEYIYIPLIPVYELEDYSFNLIEHPAYKKYLNEVIDKISKTKNYNSVGSLIDYIDTFNETVNGNSGFNKQTIIQDLELDFNGIYNRHENKLKNILTNKIPTLKPVERLDETFEEFIQKQEKLKFEFTINNDEFTFYGACPDFDDRYNNLRNEKTFKIDPKEIFLEVYNTQIVSLQIQEEKRMQEEKARKEAEERAKAREERRKKEEEEEKQRQELRRKQEEERRKKKKKKKDKDKSLEENKKKKDEKEKKRKKDKDRN